MRLGPVLQAMLSGCVLALSSLGCGGDGSAGLPATAAPRPESWRGVEPLQRAALEEALERVDEEPRSAQAWARLATVYHANDFVDLAEPCYRAALARDELAARPWYGLSRLLSELGDVAGALDAMTRAAELEPSLGFLHWRRGMALLQLGRTDEAAEAFDTALERDADDPIGWVGRAYVAEQRGANDEAIDRLEHVLASFPDVPNARHVRHLLGTAYQRAGRDEEARALLSTEPSPGLAWPDPWNDALFAERRSAQSFLQRAHGEIAAGRPAEGLALLEELRAAGADDPALTKMIAMAHFALGESGPAIAAMEELARERPDFATFLNLGFALEREAAWERALEATDRALAFDPGSLEAAMQRGRILFGNAQHTSAALQFERVARDRPEFGRAHLWLARARLELGELDAASASLAEAARAGAPTPEVDAVGDELEARRASR